MFWYICGNIIAEDGNTVTILVENTGLWLEVLVSPNVLIWLWSSRDVKVFIHHHITEAGQTLFGFESLDEKILFRMLIKVSGIGGKTALWMLALGEEALLRAIQTEDDALLSSIPGIGKKTAQKIIVDLKGSIDFSKKKESATPKSAENIQIIQSLMNYGFDKIRVEEVVSAFDSTLTQEEKMRKAILELSKK